MSGKANGRSHLRHGAFRVGGLRRAPTPAPHKELLTAAEVCQRFRLNLYTLYQMTSEKRIPHYKVGGSLRFDPEELAGWLEEQRVRVKRQVVVKVGR